MRLVVARAPSWPEAQFFCPLSLGDNVGSLVTPSAGYPVSHH